MSTAAATAPRSEDLLAGTVWHLVTRRAAESPHATVVVDENRHRVTFAELKEAAERTAAGLLARGVRPGDVVSWQLPNRIGTITLAVALARLGVVQNPLVMMLRERELKFICAQAGTRWLAVPGTFRGVDHEAMGRAVAQAQPGLEVLLVDGELPEGDPAALPPPPEDPAAVRWIFYTSGTTSDPKGAKHCDRGLIAASNTFCAHLGVRPEDVTATLLPLAHVGGIAHILTALIAGSTMVTSAVFVPDETPELLAAEGVTLLGSGLPFIQVYLARQRERDTPLFPKVRVTMCGGSPRPEALHYQVKAELGGVGVVSGYGMTECPYLTWGRWDDNDADHAKSEGPPGPGGEAIVVREDGSRAPDGEPGEIRVKGPQLMLGYVDSSLDADAFDEHGYFRTGDLGYRDSRGYVTVTGRLKDVIIRKMENISARELEELLSTHPAVADVAVIGVPDPETGERACAVVVPGNPAAPPDLATLCAHLREHGLSIRKLPEQLELIDSLPRNAMGKVVKRELTARFGGTR
ncbi:class I adenylate-forming enzyme family protein [Amycolatopsis sp.]|uniref:class I adenylate-forming enzyme family protein n=1 Tax=Amycolatopsis sp. TaxID=37632 RepID=UPI002C564298|nr:AMP-binding protein [Amycolatopsis sp.]HVV08056.1 AMP-binding protein [Amycolatopsis sp.]